MNTSMTEEEHAPHLQKLHLTLSEAIEAYEAMTGRRVNAVNFDMVRGVSKMKIDTEANRPAE